VRKAVVEWIKIVKNPDAARNELIIIRQISRFLPEPMKAQAFLQKFSSHMREEPQLLQKMEKIVQPNASCKKCKKNENTIIKILNRLGQPVTDPYCSTIKLLLERTGSVMIDEEAIRVFHLINFFLFVKKLILIINI